MTNNIIFIALFLSLVFSIMALPAQLVLASEVTGTLSTDSTKTVVQNPVENQSSPTTGQLDIGFIVKTMLVSMLIIEILVLVILNVNSRRKKDAYV